MKFHISHVRFFSQIQILKQVDCFLCLAYVTNCALHNVLSHYSFLLSLTLLNQISLILAIDIFILSSLYHYPTASCFTSLPVQLKWI